MARMASRSLHQVARHSNCGWVVGKPNRSASCMLPTLMWSQLVPLLQRQTLELHSRAARCQLLPGGNRQPWM